MATIDYIDDWAARLRSRLYTQFRGKTSWTAWCDEVLGPQFQDLEDAGQTLLTLLSIEDSEGVQLDTIGRVVGQPRNGVNDDTYRLYLSARILANKSTGTVDDIFKVMRALFGQDETAPTYTGGFVKQFQIAIGAVLTRAEALIAASFLRDSKEAGARGLLYWKETSDSLAFNYAGDGHKSTTLGAAATGGDTTITVNAVTGGLPATGRLFLGRGSAFREYVNYTAVVDNGPNYTVTLATGLVRFYSSGAAVDYVTMVGAGYNDGAFAGTLEA